MARPLGEVAQAALEALTEGPLMARDLSNALKVPERTMKNICHRLVSSGHARVAGSYTSAHARRPVALYSLPENDRTALMNTIWHR